MSRPRSLTILPTAGAVLVALARPETLLACATCYGQSDSPLAQALNWGILALLAVLLCVLGGIALFFVHVARRAAAVRAAERETLPDNNH